MQQPPSFTPYGGLDPERRGPPTAPQPLWPSAGTMRVLLRGLRKRCPRCGERRIFESWFRVRTTCPRCDLLFEKEEGGFLGAMTLNYTVGFAAWLVMLAIWLAFTVPDVPVGPILVASVALLVVLPLWFYPRSKSLWAAVEFLVLRNDPDYRPPVVRPPGARELE
jgi:uncharacterized protein (DUF983 family)